MLYEILEWLQLINLPSQIVQNQSASNFLIVAYALTFKRSWLFAVAFLLCEILTKFQFFGFLLSFDIENRAVAHHLAVMLLWSVIVKSHVNYIKNKTLAVWCCIMILTIAAAATDRAINPYDKTYTYNNYAGIVVFVHCCIILSIYKPKTIIRNLVFELRSFGCIIFSAYSVQFICYNIGKFTQHNSIFKSS